MIKKMILSSASELLKCAMEYKINERKAWQWELEASVMK